MFSFYTAGKVSSLNTGSKSSAITKKSLPSASASSSVISSAPPNIINASDTGKKMVFYEGPFPDFCEDDMSLHFPLFEKYTAIREDSVYKIQNVGMYYQISVNRVQVKGDSIVGAMRLDFGTACVNYSVIKVAKR